MAKSTERKAQAMSMNTIVMAVLALIVLVVMAIVFRSQISKSVEGYSDITEGAISEAKGEKCSILSGERCGDCDEMNSKEDSESNYIWIEVDKECSDKEKQCCARVKS